MAKYLIKNGRVIDPVNKIDDILDILMSDGKIEKVDKNIDDSNLVSLIRLDAKGMIVAPGFVDMHTHLREPGREDEETVLTGTLAAIKGGFTSVACMPNTEPPLDNPAIIRALKDTIKKDAAANVFVIGSITEGRAGKRATDFHKMKKAGAVAVSDDGSSVDDETVMSAALEQSKEEDLLVITHCEDRRISGTGVMNHGFTATKLGLKGIPSESEYERVKRDIELAKKASARIHIAHVSTKESVDIIRRAKADGVKVTAEAAPHYLALTEECSAAYDTNTKMNPPLRSKEDSDELKKGLEDGTIDVIATDHAPHTDSEKDVEFAFAPFGIIGLETALSLSAMELVGKKILSWPELIVKMSVNPSNILGINRGNLKKGSIADVVIIDPSGEYTYTKDSIVSRSKNSPFINWILKGKVAKVFVGGRLVTYEAIKGKNNRE
ncbi:MAG: dihydroorotase [Candidatus Omnitrophota bacterium]|nr:dihydroorotase [Candidatus Omnitrophota bacterium]